MAAERENVPGYYGDSNQGENYPGQNYQEENYQGENYLGENYQGESYQGENYQGENYQGENYQGENYQGENYQEENGQGESYQGENFQGDPVEGGNFAGERASVLTTTSERSRCPPLTRMLMSGEMSGEPPKDLTLKEKLDVWMVNEGYRRLFVAVFALLHIMIFVFAFLNYDLKDNLTVARTTFGVTYSIARSAALVLHFDVALLLFRM
jgi:hypothetical protein